MLAPVSPNLPVRSSEYSARFAALFALFALMLPAAVASQDLPADYPPVGQDRLAIYFDEALTQTTATTVEYAEFIDAYLVLENPSAPGAITGWEAFLVGYPVSWFIVALPEGAVDDQLFDGHHRVTFSEAIPAGDKVLLAQLSVYVYDIHTSTSLNVGAIDEMLLDGRMSYTTGADPAERHLAVSKYVQGGLRDGGAVAWVNVTGEADLQLVDSNLDFGLYGTNRTDTQWVLVTNSGDNFTHLAPSLSSESGDFRLVFPAQAGESVVVKPWANYETVVGVEFAPSVAGPQSATVDLGGGMAPVTLTGEGREPILAWDMVEAVEIPAAIVGLNRYVNIGIQNVGDIDIVVAPELPAGCEGLSIDGSAEPYVIGPSQYGSVRVRVHPVAVGPIACDLTVGPGLPPVALTGTAREPMAAMDVTGESVGFGALEIGQWLPGEVVVRNSGEVPLNIMPWIQTANSAITLDAPYLYPLELVAGAQAKVRLRFAPTDVGDFESVLVVESEADTVHVPLRGTGVEVGTFCDVQPAVVELPPSLPGETVSTVFTVTNLADRTLNIQPDELCRHFSASGGGSIGQGESCDVTVSFLGVEYGMFECWLSLTDERCARVQVQAPPRLDFGPDENRVGLFFDEGLSDVEAETGGAAQNLTCYLALLNPSETAGVGGWECRVASTGSSLFHGWTLAGNAINAGTDLDFAVGLGLEPLPYSPAVVLATFDLLAWGPAEETVELMLQPTARPSIAGMMAWTPWGDEQNLKPMLPLFGDAVVAWVNGSQPVATEFPTPTAVAGDRVVELSWQLPGTSGRACHVYRRAAGETVPTRLTAEPVAVAGSGIRFSDRTDALTPGATFFYSYAVLDGGREIGRSPEVEITIAGAVPHRTALLPNVPNPFNPETVAAFELRSPGPVRLAVYDLTGRRIAVLADETLDAGRHERAWRGRGDDGRPVASGVYHLRLETADGIEVRKMTLLK